MSDPQDPQKYLSPLDRHAAKESAPPPLPSPPRTPSVLSRASANPEVIPTASNHPLIRDVMEGKRYVFYPYVVSLLVISLRRTMGGLRVVETGAWPLGPLFGAAAVTGLFGWWGFPWGLIWTPLTLYHLSRGGRDVSRDLIVQIVGRDEAARIMKSAPKPKPPAGIWLVRLLLLLPLLWFVLGIVAVALSSEP